MSYDFQRQNVFAMGSDWADPILWYARGIKAMKARKLDDITSWNFFGAIHGMWRELWDFYQITDPSDPAPSAADMAAYVDQCQHQSWYFLPWHRGYLLALEAMIRHEIELQGGPHDTWALPYWNYFASNENVLPPAFRTPDWPDGTGDNPLFVEQRWGVLSGSTPFDVSSATNLDPMDDPVYTGTGGGGSTGFGGEETGFHHGGGRSGGLENNPHNAIHGLVGGGNPTQTFPNGQPLPGLMSTPPAAGLDPIFYLHHCNIDRLWESWNKNPDNRPVNDPTDWKNPTDPKWLDGPASIGEREFAMPNPDKSKWVYTPGQMQDIQALGYTYDDLTPGEEVPAVTLASRMVALGMPQDIAASARGQSMPRQNKVEMMGANDSGVSLSGRSAVRSSVRTAPTPAANLSRSLRATGGAPALPDRVFLNLENVTGVQDGAIFRVYVGLPDGATEAEKKDYLAGSISLFGVTQASDPSGGDAGNGISYSLEITGIVDRLHLGNRFDPNDLSVEFDPIEDIPEAANVRIGRISIYRQFE